MMNQSLIPVLVSSIVSAVIVLVSIPSNGYIDAFTIQQSINIITTSHNSHKNNNNNHGATRARRTGSSTALNLEDWVAEMIDGELYRQHHKKEYEIEWMTKNKGAVIKSLSNGGGVGDGADEFQLIGTSATTVDQQDFREFRKDRRMAENDPQRYCADRCVATGNCDVYEDLFDFTPEQVMSFCTDCVLAEHGEEECEIPEKFFNSFENLRP